MQNSVRQWQTKLAYPAAPIHVYVRIHSSLRLANVPRHPLSPIARGRAAFMRPGIMQTSAARRVNSPANSSWPSETGSEAINLTLPACDATILLRAYIYINSDARVLLKAPNFHPLLLPLFPRALHTAMQTRSSASR